MPVVPVTQLKMGDKLIEQVFTKRGNLLLDKGIHVTPRELEILRAFMISLVAIETKGGTGAEDHTLNTQDRAASPSLVSFYAEYEAMIALFRKVLNLARTGGTLPMLEIRSRMEALLQQIDSYSILSFSPRNLNIQEYLLHGSVMVALTSYQLAKWHGISSKDLMPVALGGLFHDIGNAKIDSNLLEKKDKLKPEELEEVRKHTIHGYQTLKNVAGINEGVKLCALQHHEREDGTGYPLGVRGDKVHPYAKIVAVADIFHAMTNHRHHKKASSPYLVLEQLHKESFGKLDPIIVRTFIDKVTRFHNGTLVCLSDRRIGEIVFSDRDHPTRPMVNVNGTIVNLMTDRSLFIQEVIQHLDT